MRKTDHSSRYAGLRVTRTRARQRPNDTSTESVTGKGRKEAGKQVTQDPVQSILDYDRAMRCRVYKHTHAHASGLEKIIIKRAVEIAIDKRRRRVRELSRFGVSQVSILIIGHT